MDHFRFLAARRQSSRSAAGAISMAVLVLLAACHGPTEDAPGDMAASSPPGETTVSPTPSDKTLSARARCRKRVKNARSEEFIPEPHREGRNLVLPVVFPDGSSADLVYPPKLKLAELGVQPAVSLGIERSKSQLLHERFLMITKTRLEEFRSDDPPIKTYEGPSGKVRMWRAKNPEDFLYPVFMHFRVGTWNVIVGDGNVGTFMGGHNRRLWAENLGGYETENGFIVLEPRAPLAFATGSGEPDIYFSRCFRFLELRLENCQDLKNTKLAKDQTAHMVDGVTVHRNETRRQIYANWCTPSRQISVYLDDHDERFVDLAVRRLKVRHVVVRGGSSSGD